MGTFSRSLTEQLRWLCFKRLFIKIAQGVFAKNGNFKKNFYSLHHKQLTPLLPLANHDFSSKSRRFTPFIEGCCFWPSAVVRRPSSLIHRRQRCPIELAIKLKVPSWLERISLWPVLFYRRLRYGFSFRKIPLTQGKFARVDPEDYPGLIRHKWSAAKQANTFYAVRSHEKIQIRMHRRIMNAPAHLVCDHIDHNGLNNTKRNLRLCTKQQNAINQRPRKDGSSKYKGVCWHKRNKKWQARIHHSGRYYHLGTFKSQRAAALAYDSAARKYHGDFACLNFP